jgi:hypothetical protein
MQCEPESRTRPTSHPDIEASAQAYSPPKAQEIGHAVDLVLGNMGPVIEGTGFSWGA